jgi:hypothetical protein
MSGNFIANKLSDDAIRELAVKTRTHYKPRPAYPLQVVNIVSKSGSVPTLQGIKALNYQIVPDAELSVEALTEFTEVGRTITVRKSVHERAKFGVGRDRFTLAHELAHAVIHDGAPKARSLVRAVPKFIKPYESSEHQADVFASAFLIDDKIAAQLPTAKDIEVEFAVSAKAAEICFERLHQRERKAALSDSFRSLARELQNPNEVTSEEKNYIQTSCPRCGNQTLMEIGIKFFCTSCDFVCDPFGDGDRL